MASLGVLPGSVIELLCPGQGRRRRQCMVKVNGGTLSLDELTAASIFVEPA
jgi:Fe2+ transport system protein FeoA